MARRLTPEEKKIEEALAAQISRKVAAYITLRDNADKKKYSSYIDVVDKMLLTGNYDPNNITQAVSNESLFLERFASIDRAYNEVNASIQSYRVAFPDNPLPESLEGALQEMRNTHTLGLSAIIRILEDRTEQLLREIKR